MVSTEIIKVSEICYLHENDGRPNCHSTIQLGEMIELPLVASAIHVHLRDAFDSKFVLLQCDHGSLGGEFLCVGHDGFWKGSREQESLSNAWKHSGELSACFGDLEKHVV